MEKEIKGMKVSIKTINAITHIPVCMSMHDIQEGTQKGIPPKLKLVIIEGWPSNNNEICQLVRLS